MRPQLKVSLLKPLQVLSDCQHMSRLSVYSGTQTVRKELEICGHMPRKALTVEVSNIFF